MKLLELQAQIQTHSILSVNNVLTRKRYCFT